VLLKCYRPHATLIRQWVWPLSFDQVHIKHIQPQAWASVEGKNGHLPPLEIGTKKQKFLENVKSGIQFWLFRLILAMTLCLPIWHSHCTRVGVTLSIACSYELAVHSCRLLACRGRLSKLGSELYSWPLLRNHRRTRRGVGLKNFRANSVFRASASWPKILNDKKYLNTVKIFRAPSVFQGKRKLLKSPECKKYIQYGENFQGNSGFQSKRELLKNPEW